MIEITYGTYLFDNVPWEHIDFAETQEEAIKKINDYIVSNNLYSAPYRRMWEQHDGAFLIDFGSHLKFFKLEEK